MSRYRWSEKSNDRHERYVPHCARPRLRARCDRVAAPTRQLHYTRLPAACFLQKTGETSVLRGFLKRLLRPNVPGNATNKSHLKRIAPARERTAVQHWLNNYEHHEIGRASCREKREHERNDKQIERGKMKK